MICVSASLFGIGSFYHDVWSLLGGFVMLILFFLDIYLEHHRLKRRKEFNEFMYQETKTLADKAIEILGGDNGEKM